VAEATDPLRAALARLAETVKRHDSILARHGAQSTWVREARRTVVNAARDLPAAPLLGRLERLEATVRRAVAVLEGPNPGICDTIWADDATTLVDLLTAALVAPAPDGEARPDGR
jgi:hypothetical protein